MKAPKTSEAREAVGYLRVSSQDQAKGLSLEDQRAAIAAWCERNRLELSAVFVEAKSGRSAKARSEFLRALAYCEQRPGKVAAFIVYDLSRFARKMLDQLLAQDRLRAVGARLATVALDIPDDHYGDLISTMFGGFNQFFSGQLSEKTSRVMLEGARRGVWQWQAPLGYRWRDGKLQFDDMAEPLRRMFEAVAGGAAPTDAARQAEALGLRARKGGTLRRQDVLRILRNPFYAGRVVSESFGVDVEGAHSCLVDQATWSRVQVRLNGGRPRATVDPAAFPLRGVLKCEGCGSNLTGSTSKGKMGGTYRYYHCWSQRCPEGVRVRGEKVESEVSDLLGAVVVEEDHWALLEAILRETWEERVSSSKQAAAVAARRATDLRARRDRLVNLMIDGGIDRSLFEEQRARIDTEIAAAAAIEATERPATADQFVAAAREVLVGLASLWQRLDCDGRQKLAALVFPEGLRVGSPGLLRTQAISLQLLQLRGSATESEELEGEALRTPASSCKDWDLRAFHPVSESLVSPTGLEPVLPP